MVAVTAECGWHVPCRRDHQLKPSYALYAVQCSSLSAGRHTDAAQEKAKAKRESDAWNRVCGTSVSFTVILMGRHCVIMPFAFHTIVPPVDRSASVPYIVNSLDDWKSVMYATTSGVGGDPAAASTSITPLTEHFASAVEQIKQLKLTDVLEDAIASMARCKMIHGDLEWRHVAMVPIITRGMLWRSTRVTYKSILIDLSRYTETRSLSVALQGMEKRKLELLAYYFSSCSAEKVTGTEEGAKDI